MGANRTFRPNDLLGQFKSLGFIGNVGGQFVKVHGRAPILRPIYP